MIRASVAPVASPCGSCRAVVDHPGIDQRAFDIDLRAGQPPRRIIGKQQRGDEGKHVAGGVAVDRRAVGGIGDDAGHGEAGKHLRNRRQPLRHAGDLVVARLGPVDQFADLGGELVLHGECLHHGNALHRFLHGADERGVDLDRFARDAPHAPHDVVDRPHQRRADDENAGRQEGLLPHHHADQADQRHQVADHGFQRHAEQVAYAGHVLVDAGRELAGAGLVVEADAQPHQVAEDPLLVAGHHAVADLGQGDRLAVGGKAAHEKDEDDGAADQRGPLVALLTKISSTSGFMIQAASPVVAATATAEGRQRIEPDIVAAVLRQDALEHGDDLAGPGRLLGSLEVKSRVPQRIVLDAGGVRLPHIGIGRACLWPKARAQRGSGGRPTPASGAFGGDPNSQGARHRRPARQAPRADG